MTKMMTPSSEAELAQIVADAKGPLTIQGGGTRGMAVDGDVLSTAGLSGIELYEPGALTIVVKAGLFAVCRGAGRESAIVAALAQDHFNDVFTNSGGKVSLVHAELGNLLTERMAFGNGLCG